MARLLRCTKHRRQETAGPAPPHPPTRTGRQQPLSDMGTAPPPRLLGVSYRRIARATGSRSPKQHRPAVCGPLPSYTSPGYSVPWTRTPPAARRPSPPRPRAPACPSKRGAPSGPRGGTMRRDHGAGPHGGTPRRDPTTGPGVGTRRLRLPKTSSKKQLGLQETFPCA